MKHIFIALFCITCCFSFTQPKKTWVAVGDSITYLNDHPEETGNRVSKGYLTRVTEKVTGLSYINQGHNGWTSGGIAAKIDSLGLVPADIYSIFLGTNDWWQGRRLGTIADYHNNAGNETVYGSFRIIINKLRSLNPSAKIILITPLQRSDFVYINNPENNAHGSYKSRNGQSLESFATAIVAIGKAEKFSVVDLYHDSGINQKNLVKYKRLKNPKEAQYKNYRYPSFTKVQFNAAIDEYPYPVDAIDMTYDGLHPSDKGNEVIAAMLAPKMQ